MRGVADALSTALSAARPQRVVMLSTIGAQAGQDNLLSQLGLVEQVLGALPLPVTFLRAGWFLENAQWDIASARERGVIASFLQPLARRLQRRLDSLRARAAPGRYDARTGAARTRGESAMNLDAAPRP